MRTVRTFDAITLVPGRAEAPTFVLTEPLSFWGGLDPATGTVIDQWHPQKGEKVSGRILLMTAGRGSSSGSSILAESIRRGSGPVGIVLLSRDAIVTVGAMVAAELYGVSCPVVVAQPADWELLAGASTIMVDALGSKAFVGF